MAQHPTATRSASRLLHLDGKTGLLQDKTFSDLVDFLSPDDLIVFNDTRVIKARLFGQKSTGGAIEVMVERILNNNEVLVQIKASRSPKAGAVLKLAQTFDVEVLGRTDDLFHVKFLSNIPILEILEQHGKLPLPPYITHQASEIDERRYQTVFAKHAGAVAAPTAGLHFDEIMLSRIKEKGINIAYVTLHVGAGTFQPVKVNNISDHKMHSELYVISDETVDMVRTTHDKGGKVIAVGTTALRALESAAQNGKLMSGSNETNIFITPGYEFKVVDKLLTNFHLPKSTLLMLVSAFAGYNNIKTAYQHAVDNQYRFFSYGDAMLLERNR